MFIWKKLKLNPNKGEKFILPSSLRRHYPDQVLSKVKSGKLKVKN